MRAAAFPVAVDDRSARRPGRPREFEIETVLDRAVDVFCERGYHGTSIADLASATGLSAGSLYKAFPDKKSVFLATVAHQSQRSTRSLNAAVEAGRSGFDKLGAALRYYAAMSCGAEGIKGCLVVSTAVELAAGDEEIASLVRVTFKRREALLAGWIRTGQADGSVAAGLDVDATARFLLSLMQGLRVFGKSKPSPDEMNATVDVALRALR